MKVGVTVPMTANDVPAGEGFPTWRRIRDFAVQAEALELDSIWVFDHLVFRDEEGTDGIHESWSVLAALAAATTRAELGPLVACAAFHPPAVLAKMAATLTEISGGRFVLALGAGWNEAEFRAFGIPFDHRVARFEEAFAIIRGLLKGERVTFDGEYHSARDAVLLPQPQHSTRLMIGSNGPRMLHAALPHVAAWNTWYEDYGNDAEGFAALNAKISAAATAAGRAPGEIARSACAFVVLDRAADERPITQSAPPIEGSADQIAARIRELAQAGAEEVILVVSPITERSIRELGEAVADV